MREIYPSQLTDISQTEFISLQTEFFHKLHPVKDPQLIILAGGPGAGKTTYRKKYLSHLNNFHIHDMDEVLVRLNSYKKDLSNHGVLLAFENNWPKAQNIANQFAQHAFENSYNIIYDRTCATNASFNDLKEAIVDKGYKATMYAFYQRQEVALERIKNREKQENRTVSPDKVIQYTQKFTEILPLYIEFIPDITLRCNDKICLSKKDGKILTYDKNALEKYFPSIMRYM